MSFAEIADSFFKPAVRDLVPYEPGKPVEEVQRELGLMVAAGHRRQGVGTALMEEAATWARHSGVTKLELHVFPHNEGAIALYRKLGYEDEGRRHRHYRIGGHYVDAILMALYLD